MPSLRKKVSTYLRQLSFHGEPRRNRGCDNVNENCFITKYLSGEYVRHNAKEAPIILYGKELKDLPCYELANYLVGSDTVLGAYTGPDGGLTSVNKSQKHLSIADPEIDFIDIPDEQTETKIETKPKEKTEKKPIDNTTMRIKAAGFEFNVTTTVRKKVQSQSLDSIPDFNEFVTIRSPNNTSQKDTIISINNNNNNSNNNNNNSESSSTTTSELACKDNNIMEDDNNIVNLNQTNQTSVSQQQQQQQQQQNHQNAPNQIINNTSKYQNKKSSSSRNNSLLKKSKSDGDPFRHDQKKTTKMGKIIAYDDRNALLVDDPSKIVDKNVGAKSEKIAGISNWQNPTDFAYGISSTLYEKNPITNRNNGEPIADCFGIIARRDSAILALADGVNWGQKASIAAKSAVHGCIHYLNNTIFSGSTAQSMEFLKTNENLVNITKQSYGPPPPRTTNKQQHSSSQSLQHNTSSSSSSSCTNNQTPNAARKTRTAESLLETSLKTRQSEKIYRQPPHIQKPPRQKNKRLSNTVNTLKLQQAKSASLSSSSNYSTAKSTLSSDEFDLKNIETNSETVVQSSSCTDPGRDPSPTAATSSNNNLITTTEEVFISLLRSFYEAHNLILENEGMLTTLTVAVVLPLKPKEKRDSHSHCCDDLKEAYLNEISPTRSFDSHKRDSLNITTNELNAPRYVCCVCNLGDSLAYVYSKKYGIRELTQGSHDVHSMRDMRDALGALGPVDGKNPELNNLTLSMSILEPGDIVFITSDGVSDNFDPVVGKFAVLPPSPKEVRNVHSPSTTTTNVRHSQRPQYHHQMSVQHQQQHRSNQRPKFLRSNTSLLPNVPNHDNQLRTREILRSKDGLPIVKAFQRHELTLLRMEDLLNKGISGYEEQCSTAKQLCQMLVDFSIKITAAKRHFLEDIDLYYEENNKVLVELSAKEQKIRRRKCLEKISTMPGKLDHASCVAYVVGCGLDIMINATNADDAIQNETSESVLETNF